MISAVSKKRKMMKQSTAGNKQFARRIKENKAPVSITWYPEKKAESQEVFLLA